MFVPTHVSCMAIARVATICMFHNVAIPRVTHDKLHKTCMFHATRKHGPRKHVIEFYRGVTRVHACKNEVIIERYHSCEYSV